MVLLHLMIVPVMNNMMHDRSSGNTNDLRGKILRIRIKEDGSYEIPEGNLFPKGTAEYKTGNLCTWVTETLTVFLLIKKTDFLYWGEVGPDANNDSFDTRGPRGYDEVNQARKAGFLAGHYLLEIIMPITSTIMRQANPANSSILQNL